MRMRNRQENGMLRESRSARFFFLPEISRRKNCSGPMRIFQIRMTALMTTMMIVGHRVVVTNAFLFQNVSTLPSEYMLL